MYGPYGMDGGWIRRVGLFPNVGKPAVATVATGYEVGLLLSPSGYGHMVGVMPCLVRSSERDKVRILTRK